MEQTVCAGSFAPRRERSTRQGPGEAESLPLRGLAGSELARQFRYWRGRSGRRYLFSIFPLPPTRRDIADVPAFENAVLLAVAGGLGAGGTILAAIDADRWPDPGAVLPLAEAVAGGADELHVHLLTCDAAERAAIRFDLAG